MLGHRTYLCLFNPSSSTPFSPKSRAKMPLGCHKLARRRPPLLSAFFVNSGVITVPCFFPLASPLFPSPGALPDTSTCDFPAVIRQIEAQPKLPTPMPPPVTPSFHGRTQSSALTIPSRSPRRTDPCPPLLHHWKPPGCCHCRISSRNHASDHWNPNR
jgi:hypothetical protein